MTKFKKLNIQKLYKCQDGQVFLAKDFADLVEKMRHDARMYKFENNSDYMEFVHANTYAYNGHSLDISNEESFVLSMIDVGLISEVRRDS